MGICRFNPPVAVEPGVSIWPTTRHGDHCAQHRAAGEAAFGPKQKVTDRQLLNVLRENKLPEVGYFRSMPLRDYYKRTLKEFGVSRRTVTERLKRLEATNRILYEDFDDDQRRPVKYVSLTDEEQKRGDTPDSLIPGSPILAPSGNNPFRRASKWNEAHLMQGFRLVASAAECAKSYTECFEVCQHENKINRGAFDRLLKVAVKSGVITRLSNGLYHLSPLPATTTETPSF